VQTEVCSVAERERLTNKERRAQAREERKRQEAEAAAKRKRTTLRNGLVTALIVGIVAAVILQAFLGGPETLDDTVLVSSSDAEDARAAAGCEMLVEREPLPDRSHFPASAAPSPDTLYPDVRPTHSGSHTESVHPIVASGASSQIDEVSTTHNLEHGAVIAWYDPEQVDAGTAREMGDWSGTLNANGFRVDRAGTAIFVSPYEDPGISSGKAIAFRAWGTAMDCDEWDETVANAFVIEHFGTHGIGPERTFAPYPADVLAFEDREVEDSDAPVSGEMEEPETGDGFVETDDSLGEEDAPEHDEDVADGDGDDGDGGGDGDGDEED
jgi:hypothetical protein